MVGAARIVNYELKRFFLEKNQINTDLDLFLTLKCIINFNLYKDYEGKVI